MIALRFRERVRQRLARFNQRGDRLLDAGNRTPGPVFRLHKIENLTIFGKTGDDPGHDAAQRGKILVSGKIFDRADFQLRASRKHPMGRPVGPNSSKGTTGLEPRCAWLMAHQAFSLESDPSTRCAEAEIFSRRSRAGLAAKTETASASRC